MLCIPISKSRRGFVVWSGLKRHHVTYHVFCGPAFFFSSSRDPYSVQKIEILRTMSVAFCSCSIWYPKWASMASHVLRLCLLSLEILRSRYSKTLHVLAYVCGVRSFSSKHQAVRYYQWISALSVLKQLQDSLGGCGRHSDSEISSFLRDRSSQINNCSYRVHRVAIF